MKIKSRSEALRRAAHGLLLTAVALFSALSFTSCYIGDTPPYPGAVNSFYDRNLDGAWMLVQADGLNVGGYAVNYLDFYGNGRGMYYYYINGRPYSEDIRYNCQMSGNSTSRYQINIDYYSTGPVTMNYWFTGNRLWMQWMSGSGTHTYVYAPTNYIPW